jgi:hypothetical protein
MHEYSRMFIGRECWCCSVSMHTTIIVCFMMWAMNIMLCHCFFIFIVASLIQDVLRKALGHVASRHYAMLGDHAPH